MISGFEKYKTVHFIGIGGIGISAIARMLHLSGKKVSGSDRSASEVTHELEKLGIKIFIGQKAEHVSSDTDLVIYTVAIPESNSELLAAKKLKRYLENRINMILEVCDLNMRFKYKDSDFYENIENWNLYVSILIYFFRC